MVYNTENKKENKITDKLKRNVTLDYISTFITNLNMQSSVWVLYLAYCGLNLAQIGLVEGIYHATSILFEVPSGAVADLLGRKKSMILSRVCIAVSCIIMLFARSFWFFALSFVIQALGNNLNSGSEEALVYDSMKYAGQEEQYMLIVYYATVFAAETVLFFYSQQYFYELGYNKIQISLILLVAGGVSCAGAVMSERLYHRFGKGTALIGALVIAAAFLGYGFRNIFVSVAALAAAGFFNSVLYPVQSEQLNSLIPSGQRATLISVDSLFFSIGMIVLFPLAGVLADRWGLTTVFAALGLALAAFTVCLQRNCVMAN